MTNTRYYVTTAYARRGRLLGRQDYDDLLKFNDMRSLLTAIQPSGKPGDPDKVIAWLKEALVEDCRSMRHFSKLTRAYYDRFLLWNVKEAFRCKLAGSKYESITGHLYLIGGKPVGGEELLRKTVESFTSAEAVSLYSGTQFNRYLEQALSRIEPLGSRFIFDLYLDKYFIESLKASSDRQSRELVDYEVDTYDIAVRLKGELQQEDRRALYVDSDIVQKCEGEASQSALLSYLMTKYQLKLDAREGTDIDFLIDSGGYRLASYQFLKYGRSAVVAYMKLKEYQTRNLIGIITGYKYNIRPDLLRQVLVVS